nr:MAG TPA: hypothetical protein [Microviridae sp.]
MEKRSASVFIAALERYTPAARVGPDRKMERSDFLGEAFRFGILARSAQRQVLPDLPCLYPYVIQAKPLVVSERKFELSSQIRSFLSINAQLTPNRRIKKNLKYFVYSKIMFSFAPVEVNSLNY